jgi:hypothetical protein
MKTLIAPLKKHNSIVISGAYPFFIRRGQVGSEGTLIQALNTSGDQFMAYAFERCGNPKLQKAGREWTESPHSGLLLNKLEHGQRPVGQCAVVGASRKDSSLR